MNGSVSLRRFEPHLIGPADDAASRARAKDRCAQRSQARGLRNDVWRINEAGYDRGAWRLPLISPTFGGGQ